MCIRDRSYGAPRITKDGVSVAKEIDLKDKFDPSKKVPVGRVGEHHELSNLAAYLLSEYSSYINGEVITIDGAEWLKGAGQFNHLDMVSDQMWDMFDMMRKKK